MSSFRELSKIDGRTKLKVYGWIREAEKELKLDFLPMISNIIILYVRDDASFDIISKDMELSNNNKCLTKIKTEGFDYCNYGKIVIPSASDTVCQWDVKMLKLTSTFRIGISSCSIPNKSMFKQMEDYHYYLFYNDSWKWEVNHKLFAPDPSVPAFLEGDMVSIHLNLKDEDGQLSIAVNDGDKYIAYSDIKRGQDISYRLMVIPSNIHDSVKIISFTKI